jgi:hypothetical protein
MVLPTNGALSLNDIHIEAGGTSQTACTINDSDIRGLTPAAGKTINTGSGTTVSINDFYGASSIPDPVARTLWESNTTTNPSTVGAVGTNSVVANAIRPSGSPDNIASTTTSFTQTVISGTYYSMQYRLNVNSISGSAFTRFYNPKQKIVWSPSNFSVIDTDLLCRIEITTSVSFPADDNGSGTPTHAAYYDLPTTSLTAYSTGSGGEWFGGGGTVTTTNTVQDFIDNSQTIELRLYIATGGNFDYLRYIGDSSFRIDVSKIAFII